MEDKLTVKDYLYHIPMLAYQDAKVRIKNRRRLTIPQREKLITGAILVPTAVILAATWRVMYKVVDLGIPFEDQHPKLAKLMYK